MSLSEFLMARIAEDEAVARDWPDVIGPPPDGYAFWVDPQGHPIYQPRTRVLAECEAKRRIVALMHDSYSENDVEYWALHDALQHLALLYADHPDYRDEWRP